MEVKGTYNTATIYTQDIEETALEEIQKFLDNSASQGMQRIAIMPDVHGGVGCVIGFTATLADRVVPNTIGVDIGCGVLAVRLKLNKPPDLKELDRVINNNVPSGFKVHDEPRKWGHLAIPRTFVKEVNRLCHITHGSRAQASISRTWKSLGTLGGGNHFIELDMDKNNDYWLVIHSGSRSLGLAVANYHQKIASTSTHSKEVEKEVRRKQQARERKCIAEVVAQAHQEKINKKELKRRVEKVREELIGLRGLEEPFVSSKKETGLEYLQGHLLQDYFRDMEACQLYAQLNRFLMADIILKKAFGITEITPNMYIESVHNYIDFKDRVIRKGAISAHQGEMVIIPFNMRDGSIIGRGKGNEKWNNSAPHGAGRVMGRNQAKKTLKLKDFEQTMKDAGVYSSCVNKATIDESPEAYKPADEIEKYLEPTVEVLHHLKPVYNFKGY